MHGPPPTPDELQARLWRYVRHPDSAGVPFRDLAAKAADDLELPLHQVFDLLGDSDF